MTGSWGKRIGSASSRFSRAAFLAVGVILIGGACAPTASADLVKAELVKEVTDTVGSTVKQVETGANAVPSLPSTTAPAKPPPQAATPASPPPVLAKPPSKESTPPSTRAESGPGAKAGSADPPSVDGVAGVARRTIDSVVGTGSEAVNRVPRTEASDGVPRTEASEDGPAAALQRGGAGGGSEAIARERRTASGAGVAVRAAEVAALQRWLARVWPAVALDGGGVDGLAVARAIAGGLLPPGLAAVTGLLLASSPVLPASGDAPLAGDQGVAGASRSSAVPSPPPSAADVVKAAYLIAIAALLGLLAFTVWREFRVALHPSR